MYPRAGFLQALLFGSFLAMRNGVIDLASVRQRFLKERTRHEAERMGENERGKRAKESEGLIKQGP